MSGNEQAMNDDEIDSLFRALPSNDPALLATIRKPILADLTPVRPLPGESALAAAFGLLFAIVLALCSYFLGFKGLHALSLAARIAVCALLLALAVAAAYALAKQMRPGARAWWPYWALPVVTIAAFEGLFFALFQDYSLGRFVHSGLLCLSFGLLCALPAALLIPLLLSRGYVVAPVSAGGAVGVGAGLVGLAVIEFHCPLTNLPHLAVWHVAIVAVSAALGAFAGVLKRRLS